MPKPGYPISTNWGFDGSLIFPTLASLLEERMRDDPDLCHAAVHSLEPVDL